MFCNLHLLFHKYYFTNSQVMDKDRLIKLLREECEGLWQCEGTSYLDKEDSAELEKLLEEYDAEQEVSRE